MSWHTSKVRWYASRRGPAGLKRGTHATCGYTMLEALVVLGIIALVTSVYMSSLLHQGDDRRRLELYAQQVQAEAAIVRVKAIRSARPITYLPDAPPGVSLSNCEQPEQPPLVRFDQRGGASGSSICIRKAMANVRLNVDWVTGELIIHTAVSEP